RPEGAGRLALYGLPQMVYETMHVFMTRVVDLLFVARIAGPKQAAIYSVSLELVAAVKKVRQSIDPIFAPVIAEQVYLKRYDKLQATFEMATRWTMTVCIAVVATYALFGEQILILHKADYAVGALALLFKAIGHAVNNITGL